MLKPLSFRSRIIPAQCPSRNSAAIFRVSISHPLPHCEDCAKILTGRFLAPLGYSLISFMLLGGGGVFYAYITSYPKPYWVPQRSLGSPAAFIQPDCRGLVGSLLASWRSTLSDNLEEARHCAAAPWGGQIFLSA